MSFKRLLHNYGKTLRVYWVSRSEAELLLLDRGDLGNLDVDPTVSELLCPLALVLLDLTLGRDPEAPLFWVELAVVDRGWEVGQGEYRFRRSGDLPVDGNAVVRRGDHVGGCWKPQVPDGYHQLTFKYPVG